ncbi:MULTISPECIES: glycoside hydrolase family 26 protein [unclassified Pseudoclavibacter]|uniref:glycoside hydrolase family 26 protein n=1 Tax=unclassified Pseudoclavibacter TaxID=2615177 RepID=UPI00130118F8|nr:MULTISPECIES: glycosyl hydrolase [unclassified Pseudoclavibacter]KAB1646516.1 hypothetical protein F8O06_07225 [Pseudoclavibacter sp. CFCC 14310]KAB1663326.1 hypothetical protein F8O08_06080 [Pseudoclavibacter sp. CFCC 13611]
MNTSENRPRRLGRTRASVVVPVVLMALSATGITLGMRQALPPEPTAAQCAITDRDLLDSTDDGVLLGVNLDWEAKSLAEHGKSLSHDPAVVVQFTDIPYDDETWQHTVEAAAQVRATGGALLLTLEPHGGLTTLSEPVVDKLVADLAFLNASGVPVIVRLAHEMNGSWYAWGQQPTAYREVFRRVAEAVYDGAPGSSMMWAPNYGGGYPFVGGQFAAVPGSVDHHLLDTDGDGTITMHDDPYAPYYPGDDVVDWAGVSLYHWGNQRPWGDNDPLIERTKFTDMLTGTYQGTAGDDSALPDFYAVYGEQHGKPIGIPETAAIYTPSRGGADELTVKQAWWNQVFDDSVHEQYPQIRMINWFEWRKFEIEINDTVDWRAAGSDETRDAFLADLPDWLLYSSALGTCRAGR